MGLSDLTHATLAVGVSSALIPLLPSCSPPLLPCYWGWDSDVCVLRSWAHHVP